jgi:hypothetical protein
MFVEWKKARIGPRNDRHDPECVHTGEGRWTWTPIVMEAYAAPSGPRRRTILRSGPELRSCCMADPVVRVRWWNATADALLAARGLDVDSVVTELAKQVPLPTEVEEAIFLKWPHNAPWRERRRIDHAASQRARVASEVCREVAAEVRPPEMDWKEAVSAWHEADIADDAHWWEAYVLHEKEGIEWAAKAIGKVRQRERFTAKVADVASWLDAYHDHACRLDERQEQRGHDEARRREREADDERRRAAERRHRAHRNTGHLRGRDRSSTA